MTCPHTSRRGARWQAVGLTIAILAATALTAVPAQQPPGVQEPRVKIVSPAADSYVTGAAELTADVDPPDAATRVVFYVDAQQVCTVTRPPYSCEWNAGAAIVEHQIRVVATLAGGGRTVATVRTKGLDVAEIVNVDVVQVTASVTDGHGHFVKGLPRKVFHLFEDGMPQAISHFESEDVPLDLTVAIDISGSMAPAMAKVKAAVKLFLAAVPEKDKVTILGFNDNILALTRRTTDRAEREKAVDRLAPWGATALYDVVLRGVDMAATQTGRKVLVVFTDGEDQGSHARIEDVERRLLESDVTLYMIAQGRGTTLESLKKVMVGLTEPTGGRALFTEKPEELHRAFSDLLDELSNQYLLGYPPTNPKRDGTLRHIRLQVDGYKQVRARETYRAGGRQ
jgi:VWFA-related protein